LTTAYQLPDTPHKTLEILRYRAESQFWQGQMDQAIVSLERAVKLSTDQAQKDQLQIRIDEMRADRKIKV
jgi:predicted Zn-dependent protease